MTFMQTTTARLVLLACLFALLRFAFLPVDTKPSPARDLVMRDAITVPAAAYISCPVRVGEAPAFLPTGTEPTLRIHVRSSAGMPSDIRLLVLDQGGWSNWGSGGPVTPLYDTRNVRANAAVQLRAPKASGAGKQNIYYVVFSNGKSTSSAKTLQATVWLDWAPTSVDTLQQSVWLVRFLLIIFGVLLVAAFWKRTPRPPGEFYALPPAPPR